MTAPTRTSPWWSRTPRSRTRPVLTPEQVVIDDPAPADNDDQLLEPAEPFLLDVNLRNGGDTGATGVSGNDVRGTGCSFTSTAATWSNIASDPNRDEHRPVRGPALSECRMRRGRDRDACTQYEPRRTTVPVTLPTGEAGSDPSRGTGGAVAIPDESSVGAASTISVAAAGLVKDLDVGITSLAHPWVGDLAIDLTSPEGTTVRLVATPGRPRQRRRQLDQHRVRRRGSHEHLPGRRALHRQPSGLRTTSSPGSTASSSRGLGRSESATCSRATPARSTAGRRRHGGRSATSRTTSLRIPRSALGRQRRTRIAHGVLQLRLERRRLTLRLQPRRRTPRRPASRLTRCLT